MLTRFIIGFSLGTIAALCANGCAAPSVGTTGNLPPTELIGIPVDEAQYEQVMAYANWDGAAALGRHDHLDYARAVQSIDFVPAIFKCDPSTYGDAMCFGITFLGYGEDYSKVAMVQADASEAPTNDVRCTSLLHETMHSLSFQITGDGDTMHTNDAVWGADGVVVKGLTQMCPGWNFTLNNLNPATHNNLAKPRQ